MVTTHTEERPLAEKNMSAYFTSHDTQYMAEDAVFISMNTGEETKGREAIAAMLHHIYHVAFDAHAVINNTIVTEHNAVMEGTFNGKHIGEFAGIPATNKDVKSPTMCYIQTEQGRINNRSTNSYGGRCNDAATNRIDTNSGR